MNDTRTILIGYRLEQADESLESAQLLLENQKYRPSVSRSYYAMFYSVLALLVKEGIAASKHTGAISAFNREFIKRGLLDRELSAWIQEAFDLRQRADYREFFTVTPERARDVLNRARIFVEEVKAVVLSNE